MKKRLNQIDSKAFIFDLLKDVGQEDILGWKLQNEKKVVCSLRVRINKAFKGELVLSLRSEADENSLREVLNSDDSVNFYLPCKRLFFKTEVLSKDHRKKEISIKYPEFLAQLDRRSASRYLIESNSYTIEFDKILPFINHRSQYFKQRIYDLSEQGVSFIISKSVKRFFKEEDLIESIQLNLDGKELFMSGRVLSILEVLPSEHNQLSYTQYRVRLKFEHISSWQNAYLQKLILEIVNFHEDVS